MHFFPGASRQMPVLTRSRGRRSAGVVHGIRHLQRDGRPLASHQRNILIYSLVYNPRNEVSPSRTPHLLSLLINFRVMNNHPLRQRLQSEPLYNPAILTSALGQQKKRKTPFDF